MPHPNPTPVFLAIATQRLVDDTWVPISPSVLQGLSPKVMAWSPDLWIVEMSMVMSYWRHVAGQRGTSLVETWVQVLLGTADTRSFLMQHPGDLPASVTALHQFTIAGAASPWQAVLLATHMKNHFIRGAILHFPPQRSADSYAHIEWDSWRECAAILGAYWAERRMTGFHWPRFKEADRRFHLAMSRLRCTRPSATGMLQSAGIQRRFGRWLALLWQWTFTPDTEAIFPWQSAVFTEKVQVSRCLEVPLTLWSWIILPLQQDLDRLASAALLQNQSHVLQLDLLLQLDNHQQHLIEIRFRHPHDLRAQPGSHPTIVAQAQRQFEAWQLTYATTDSDLDTAPAITGWCLSIEQHLQVTPVLLDLFGAASTVQSELETLCQIENDLPIPLAQYEYADEWLPEYSMEIVATHELDPLLPHRLESRPSLSALALQRPLYVMATPVPIAMPDQRVFLESITVPWWHDTQSPQSRTYYRARLPDGRWGWVYQENTLGGKQGETWRLHGLYL